MGNETRRTLDELVAIYEFEPELRDIYVEGKTDKLFFQWFVEQKVNQDFVVYEIDTVDISASKLFELGLIDNNRSRVIALALIMQQKLAATTFNLTCIADKDFDWLFGIEYKCDLLLFTDYSCLEMYLFNEVVLNKFLLLGLRISRPTAKELLDQLPPVLEELFLIRATDETLQLEMDWLDKFGGCCESKTNHIKFDSAKFIDKFLNKNIKMPQKSKFIAKLGELRTKEITEIRYKIHGHDFTELFCWYIRPHLREEIRNSYNPEILAAGLLACVDAENLIQEPLFQQLLVRICR